MNPVESSGIMVRLNTSYDAFVNTVETGALLNETEFTGAISDGTTGLYYLNARYYNSNTGRFISQDSYKGSAYEPWTQNLYTYTGNNPVNYTDPTGHWSVITQRKMLFDGGMIWTEPDTGGGNDDDGGVVPDPEPEDTSENNETPPEKTISITSSGKINLNTVEYPYEEEVIFDLWVFRLVQYNSFNLKRTYGASGDINIDLCYVGGGELFGWMKAIEVSSTLDDIMYTKFVAASNGGSFEAGSVNADGNKVAGIYKESGNVSSFGYKTVSPKNEDGVYQVQATMVEVRQDRKYLTYAVIAFGIIAPYSLPVIYWASQLPAIA